MSPSHRHTEGEVLSCESSRAQCWRLSQARLHGRILIFPQLRRCSSMCTSLLRTICCRWFHVTSLVTRARHADQPACHFLSFVATGYRCNTKDMPNMPPGISRELRLFLTICFRRFVDVHRRTKAVLCSARWRGTPSCLLSHGARSRNAFAAPWLQGPETPT